MDRSLTTLSRWRGPLPGTCSYAVPSQTRVSLWIFEGNGIETPELVRLVHDHEKVGRGSANISSTTDSREESNHAFRYRARRHFPRLRTARSHGQSAHT